MGMDATNFSLPVGTSLLTDLAQKRKNDGSFAALYDPSRINARKVAFDNKLNVLHRGGCGLPEDLAKGGCGLLE